MAKTSNPMRIRGTIGDCSFVKHPLFGWYVRRKGGPSAEKIFNAPSFERTRKNIGRFGDASRCGKLLRNAFDPLTRELKDTLYHNRVQSAFSKIIASSDSFTNAALLKHMYLLNETPVNKGNTLTQIQFLSAPERLADRTVIRTQLSTGRIPIKTGDVCLIRAMLIAGDVIKGNYKTIGETAIGLTDVIPEDVREVILSFPVSLPRKGALLCVTVQFYDVINGKACMIMNQHMYAGKLRWLV